MTRLWVYVDKEYMDLDSPLTMFVAKEFKFTSYGACEFFSDGREVGYVDRHWIISKIVKSEPGKDDEVVWSRDEKK